MGKRSYTIDYDTDYHKRALEAAEKGDWDEFDYALTMRDIKINETGDDYGTSTSSIRHDAETKYNRYPAAKTENDPLGFYGGSSPSNKARQAMREYENYSYKDYLRSDNYKALEKQYTQAGQKSMDDTLGKVSARTGGLASTYAVGAAQGKFDEFMYDLAGIAAEMYDVDRDELMERAMAYNDLAQQDYKKYQDARDFAYSVQGRKDAAAEDESRIARSQVDDLIAKGIIPDGDLIDKSGYSMSYVEKMVSEVKKTMPLTPEQAQKIYNDANKAMKEKGISVPGMLTYEDWLKVQNDPNGEWKPSYGVTQTGYNLARNNKTYEEYANAFVDFMSKNNAVPSDGEGFEEIYAVALKLAERSDSSQLEKIIRDVESGQFGEFTKSQVMKLHILLDGIN